ncbi:MAG TPA: hypothetical protein VG271_14140 [Beijerinckiaceae bacterium]|jgi:tripartite-type tricarboxylate transporter receptor subunit TctC|nr:hypothetical protein [Beijerinckiaceae bacterium]
MNVQRFRALLQIPLLGLFSTLSVISASKADAPFYAGKTVTIVVGGEAGASYDLYARLLGEFLPKYLPGRPAVVVQDMPGANGALSAGYMANQAVADGTIIAECVSNLPTYPLLHPDVAKFDAAKLSWIGSVTKDIYVAYVGQGAPINSYEGAKKTQAIMGGVLAGAASVQLAVVSNALFGTKFKIVPGYGSESKIELAIERGEVQGSFGAVYTTLKTDHADWLRNGKVKIILQHGLEKIDDLADVPLFIDQARTTDERQMLTFLLAPQEFNKPFYAPPGIPAERLELLRRAFDATVKDADFLAAATKANVAVLDPMRGEDVAAAVNEITTTPRPVIDRLKSIFADFAAR